MPSEKILKQKEQQVEELSAQLKDANIGVLVSYSGMNVEEDTKLRKQLREAGCTYRVIKNTILKRAFAQAGIEGLDASLEGTTAIAYAQEDYVSAPKILSEQAKKVEPFTIKSGFIDGEVVENTQIEALAKLPTKEVLLAQAVGGLNAPIQGLANVTGGLLRGLVTVINAIAEKTPA